MSKKTLNKTNLEALGAAQLAELLIEVSAGSADIKRRLRLEISHSLGASELARDVRKRLASIRKSNSFVGWRKRKALIKDLRTQSAMITEKIAPDDPTGAFDLLWEFIEIAPSVYGRVDDSKGDVGDVFREALAQFETITPRAILDREALAERVWTALQDNEFGEWDGLIALMVPALGSSGLARLKACVQTYAAAPAEAETEAHEAFQFLRELRGGYSYAAERKARFVKWCLQEIAAVTGDTRSYIAQYSEADLARKDIAAEVALLMLQDAQDKDAMEILLAADQDQTSLGQDAWDAAYIATLTALGRANEAQIHRWACFEASLSDIHLRDYLKLLPDFDDVEAEEQARQHVLSFNDFPTALAFCLRRPDLLTAARLIETRAPDINGDQYFLLAPAAETLRSRHPLAAILLWRAMIDFTLEQGRASRYGHAADHLADCGALDAEITDYKTFVSHDHYLEALRTRHHRKLSFWKKIT